MRVLTLPAPQAFLASVGVITITTVTEAASRLVGQTVAVRASSQPPTATTVIGEWEAWPADAADDPHPNHPDGRPARIYCNRPDIGLGLARWYPLPLGAVIATAAVTACLPILRPDEGLDVPWMPHIAQNRRGDWWHWKGPTVAENLSTGTPQWDVADIGAQIPYGHFTPGLFGLVLTDVVRLPAPVVFDGDDWEPTDAI